MSVLLRHSLLTVLRVSVAPNSHAIRGPMIKSRCKHYAALVSVSAVLVAGCSSAGFGPRPHEIEAPKYSIYSRVPFVSIDGEQIVEQTVIRRKPSLTTITYDGPINITIDSPAIVPVEEKNAGKNAMTACLAALPICPLTLTLMAAISGTKKHVEADCNTTVNFVPVENQDYFVKLEATDNVLPVLKIINKISGLTVASEKLRCDGYSDAPTS